MKEFNENIGFRTVEEFNENIGFRTVEDYDVCRKLSDVGVELIILTPTGIEFEWCERICSYKNGSFYCGTQVVKCDDINKLDSNFLYELVGKLTDDQLERLGNLIDLYEDNLKHLESQLEDMKSVSMYGTDVYRIKEEQYRNYTELIAMLRTPFETRDFERDQYGYSIEKYVLKGE